MTKTQISLVLALCAGGACKQENQAATEQAKQTAEETRKDLERVRGATLPDRAAFLAKAQDEVRDIDLRIQVIDGRLQGLDADARKDIEPLAHELRASRDDLKDAIAAMRAAGSDAVDQARASVERAIGRIEKAHDALVGKLATYEANPSRPDSWLTLKVKAKILNDDLIKSGNVHVNTTEGVVTLQGTVGSEAARTRAMELAKTTIGVKGVMDELTVAPIR